MGLEERGDAAASPVKPQQLEGTLSERSDEDAVVPVGPSTAAAPATSEEEAKAAKEAAEKKEAEACSYWKLYSTADKVDYVLIFFGLVGAAGGGVLMPLFSVIFGQFINAFGSPDPAAFMDEVSRIALNFFYLAIAAFVAMYMESAFFVWSGNRQTNRLRMRFLNAVLKQDVAFFDTAATTGGLLQNLNQDSTDIQLAISDKAANFVHHACTFLSGFIIAFVRGWDMTLVMVACMPFLAIMGFGIAAFSSKSQSYMSKAYTDAAAVAQQSIANVRTVTAYNGQDSALARYSKSLEGMTRVGIKAGVGVGCSLGGMQFVMYCAYAVALFYGAYRIVAGKYDGGQVINVQFATLMASFALGQAAPNLQYFFKGRVAGARFFKVLERVPDLKDVGDVLAAHGAAPGAGGPGAAAAAAQQKAAGLKTHGAHHKGATTTDVEMAQNGAAHDYSIAAATKAAVSLAVGAADTALAVVPAAAGHVGHAPVTFEPHEGNGELAVVHGAVQLKDIVFCYPARPDVTVLNGFNLSVPAGYTAALVGSSGSGKSTVVQLLQRFYDPMAGAVLLDGVDLRALRLHWLRSHMGLVSQEPTLFATTIAENIALGKPGATQQEIEAAAVAANAHRFISAQPLGYNTQVGERGVQLSGGQKQRIAIARAILRNPKILLLDEATSALDTQSERLVQRALDRMMVGRTTFVVAHRLSTVQHAHIIAVVGAGQVVEQGSHAQLLQNPHGAYTNLVQLQMQHQAEEAAQPSQGNGQQHEAAGGNGDHIGPIDEHEDDIDEEQLMEQEAAHVSTSVSRAASGADAVHDGVVVGGFADGRASSGAVPGAAAGETKLNAPAAPAPAVPALPGEVPFGTSAASVAGATGRPVDAGPHSFASGGNHSIDIAQDGKRTSSSAVIDIAHHDGTRASSNALAVAGSGQLPRHSHPGKHGHGAAEKKKLSEEEQKALDEAAAKQIPMMRLLQLNKPEWPAIALGCIGSAGAGLQHPFFAFVITDMILIFFYTDMDELKRKASFYAWMFFVLGVGSLIMVCLQQVCFSYAGQRLAQRIRILLLGALLRQDIAFFDADENSSGRLTSTLAQDAGYIRGAVADSAGVALQNAATLAAGYAIAFAFDWRMSLLITGALPLLMIAMVVQMKWATGSSTASDTLYAGANQYVTEAFSSVRVIHAYNLQGYVSGRYTNMLHDANKVLMRQAQIGGIAMGFSFFCVFALYGLIIFFGGWEIDQGLIDFNDMMKAFVSLLMAAMGMAQAGVAFPDLGKAKAAVGRVFPMLDRVPAIDSQDQSGQAPATAAVNGQLELQHIKFFYPSRPSVIIYKDFNLVVPPGKACALVGESGSGKSSVVSLLLRFYDPVEGCILLDGVDIRSYNIKWLRSQIGLVSQEPVLFDGTVADNIRYGNPNASQEEVEAAAEVANAADFVSRLPEKFHTKVGEGGIQLSGGQKQRIAIARAVVKNPKILLLDEATSALDARSERAVQAALDRVSAGRTSLVIAHRLSTIRNAHAICVLYRGTILEQGTHSELMTLPGGAYARLVAAQETAHNAEA